MDGLRLLREGLDAGLRIEARDDQLVVQGPRRLEPIARRLLAAKRHVMDAIRVEHDWRVEAMRSQVPVSGGIPLLVARPGTPMQPGSCYSCGAKLESDVPKRCAGCLGAVIAVLAQTR